VHALYEEPADATEAASKAARKTKAAADTTEG
jgi:hypothetical protein